MLGFNGQEPGEGGKVLWMFLDLLNNRVLHTCVADAMDYEALRVEIEGFRARLGITFIGWVSDKQGSIVKCHDLYFPAVPHQYCQFHVRQANCVIECLECGHCYSICTPGAIVFHYPRGGTGVIYTSG